MKAETTKMLKRAATYSASHDTEVYIICRNHEEIGRLMKLFIEDECWKHDLHPQAVFISMTSCASKLYGRVMHSENTFVDNFCYDDGWDKQDAFFMRELDNRVIIGNSTLGAL